MAISLPEADAPLLHTRLPRCARNDSSSASGYALGRTANRLTAGRAAAHNGPNDTASERKLMTSLRAIPTDTLNPWAYRLPDIPEKHPDDMTSSKHLAKGGNQGRVEIHLGNPETTIVSGELYICAAPGTPVRYPDLLVAFDADPGLYEANNGYVVSLQGKPPDLVLEIASRHTWQNGP